jgi:hypothetical protein
MVRRLSKFDIPSDSEPFGLGEVESTGDDGRAVLPPSAEEEVDGADNSIWASDNAVVGPVFAAPGDTEEALPNGGRRPTENLEEDDTRDARDPGLNGDETLGPCPRGPGPVRVGDKDGSGEETGDGDGGRDGDMGSRTRSTGA